jgi:hypothetical protein
MFKITSVSRDYNDQVKVRVRVDAKYWNGMKKRGQLGCLYGIDISNECYKVHGVKAYNPTVSDKDRASGGLKWITLYYTDPLWRQAPDNVVSILPHILPNTLGFETINSIACHVIHVDFRTKKRIAA